MDPQNSRERQKLEHEQQRTFNQTQDHSTTVIFGSNNRGTPQDSAEYRARQKEVSQRGPKAPEEEGGIPETPKPSLDFQKALQQARTARNLKQSDLAKALNIKASQINEWESGKAVPNGQERARLGRMLGVNFGKAGGPRKKQAAVHPTAKLQ